VSWQVVLQQAHQLVHCFAVAAVVAGAADASVESGGVGVVVAAAVGDAVAVVDTFLQE